MGESTYTFETAAYVIGIVALTLLGYISTRCQQGASFLRKPYDERKRMDLCCARND
ncbi:protein of unknown function [Candidatus Nitrospira inopinata]|uniref:Uncharacterized protein n=1 Tax=Candidatus Nitrospira inopinata TaxID=1715989 RepID=A0A0S4KVK3_9BACT|nr:protein of unknown function [Candidatus Nitrospira inopinata]